MSRGLDQILRRAGCGPRVGGCPHMPLDDVIRLSIGTELQGLKGGKCASVTLVLATQTYLTHTSANATNTICVRNTSLHHFPCTPRATILASIDRSAAAAPMPGARRDAAAGASDVTGRGHSGPPGSRTRCTLKSREDRLHNDCRFLKFNGCRVDAHARWKYPYSPRCFIHLSPC
ncbi:hypothetical protein EVAR_12680_1 [Eumeta japonica]|uniref:Uncharacterized protein n=1 Tax=Eumeta variegata TaxID=151549 RepID=A0A4C1Z1J8_EUMVA|nr:hypothetical protein EVAR_12680_1 [Eumeta japonica]